MQDRNVLRGYEMDPEDTELYSVCREAYITGEPASMESEDMPDIGEVNRVSCAVCGEHPEMYWHIGRFDCSHRDGVFTFAAVPEYGTDDRKTLNRKIANAAYRVTEKCGLDSGTEEERLMRLFRYAEDSIRFSDTGTGDYCIVNPLLKRTGCSLGVSAFMAFMLRRSGIRCSCVSGSYGEDRMHRWNRAVIGGRRVEFDVSEGRSPTEGPMDGYGEMEKVLSYRSDPFPKIPMPGRYCRSREEFLDKMRSGMSSGPDEFVLEFDGDMDDGIMRACMASMGLDGYIVKRDPLTGEHRFWKMEHYASRVLGFDPDRYLWFGNTKDYGSLYREIRRREMYRRPN